MSTRSRIAIALVGLVGFAALASQARGDSILRGDIRFARWIQGRDLPLLDPLVDAANASMRTGPLVVAGLLIIGLLAWRRWWVEAGLLFAASVLMHLSNVMKELFESPRPTPDLVRVTEHAATYGFPGGRAGNAVLFLWALAWIASRRLGPGAGRVAIWAAAVVWTLLTGAARVRVGAHWPSDIYGAWLWTLPALLLLIAIADRIHGSRFLADRGRPER
jgi:membrane-associated phospholipid phosphatase